MKTTIKVLLSAMILLTASCSKEIDGHGAQTPDVFTLKLALPAQTSVQTYAPDDDRENEVNRLDVFIMNEKGEILNTVGHQTIRSFSQSGSLISASVAMDRKIPQQQFFVIANATDAMVSGITKSSQLKDLIGGSAKMPVQMFLMSGESPLRQVGDIAAGLELSLSRAVARFDVKLDNVVNNLKIKSARIINARDKSYVFQRLTSATKGKVVYPATAQLVKYDAVEMSSSQSRGFKSCLYAYENYNPEPAKNENTTSIMLGGEYGNSGVITYYRIDIKDRDLEMQIIRNNHYEITITEVEGPGFVDEGEAELDSKANLRYSIEIWRQSDINTEFDGTLSLSVSECQVQIPRDAFGGTIMVKTNAGAWGVTAPQDASDRPATWLTVKQEGDVCNYLAPVNNSGAARTAKFFITAGSRLKIRIEVTQSYGESSILKLTSTSVPAPFLGTGDNPVFTEMSVAREDVTWTIDPDIKLFGDMIPGWVSFVDNQVMTGTGSMQSGQVWTIKLKVQSMTSDSYPRSALVKISARDNKSNVIENYKFTVVQLNNVVVSIIPHRRYIAAMGDGNIYDLNIKSNWKWKATFFNGSGSTAKQLKYADGAVNEHTYGFVDASGKEYPRIGGTKTYLSYEGEGDHTLRIKFGNVHGAFPITGTNKIRDGYVQIESVGGTTEESVVDWVRLHHGDYNQVEVNGMIILDRNLGATYAGPGVQGAMPAASSYAAMGHRYQWGRVPDGYEAAASGSGLSTSSVSAVILNNIPLKIELGWAFPCRGNGHSWFEKNSNTPAEMHDFGKLWDAKGLSDYTADNIENTNYTGVRTMYDPCPEGFRVPTAKELRQLFLSKGGDNGDYVAIGDMTSGYQGRYIRSNNGKDIYLPAGGAAVPFGNLFVGPSFDDPTYGMGSLLNEGYYMSSSIAGDNSKFHFLYFDKSTVKMMNVRHPLSGLSYGAGAMSVRCVK